MSVTIKDFDFIDISKMIWKSKLSIFIITIICVITSYIIFNLQKINEYWEAKIIITVYEPNLKQNYFDIETFERNLLETMKTQGHDLDGKIVRVYGREIDQFGEITNKNKKFLNEERERLIENINKYLRGFIKDIEAEIFVLEGLITENMDEMDEELNVAFNRAIELATIMNKNDSDIDVSNYTTLYLSILNEMTSASNAISGNEFKKRKADLELLKEKFNNRMGDNRLVNVSDLLNMRLIRSSWKIYILLGFAIGILMSVLYVSIKNNFENSK